jgi:hypothetical protein
MLGHTLAEAGKAFNDQLSPSPTRSAAERRQIAAASPQPADTTTVPIDSDVPHDDVSLRTWLYKFFSRADPPRLRDVEFMVAGNRTGEKAAALAQALRSEYAARPPAVTSRPRESSDASPQAKAVPPFDPPNEARRSPPPSPSPPRRQTTVRHASTLTSSYQQPLPERIEASPHEDDYADRVRTMYAHYSPTKLMERPNHHRVMIERYRGSEIELLAALVAKYGPEPPRARPPQSPSRLAASPPQTRTASPTKAGDYRVSSPIGQLQVPPPNPLHIQGLAVTLLNSPVPPQQLLAAMTIRYGPEPDGDDAALLPFERRLVRFVEVYWAEIVQDSVDRGTEAMKDVFATRAMQNLVDGGAATDTSTHYFDRDAGSFGTRMASHHQSGAGSPSPRGDRASPLGSRSPRERRSVFPHRRGVETPEPSMPPEVARLFHTRHPVLWADIERLDPMGLFPALRLEPFDQYDVATSPRGGRPSESRQLLMHAPLMPVELTRFDVAQLPSLPHVRSQIRWLSRVLVWDDDMLFEPRMRYVMLTDNALLILTRHDQVVSVTPLPGPDNDPRAHPEKHTEVDVTVFQPDQQCPPAETSYDVPIAGFLPMRAYRRPDDDVCVVALKVKPSRMSDHLQSLKSKSVRDFERRMAEGGALTTAEATAQSAVLAEIAPTPSLTLVFPGTFLGSQLGDAREAASADRHRPPLQRSLAPHAGKRFIACLSKLILSRGGGPDSLTMRQLHVRCDAPSTGFSYLRETGGTGLRLDHELLAAHVRQGVVKARK